MENEAMNMVKRWFRSNKWFAAYTGVCAVLMGWVFWGTWSGMACPVMPDAAMTFPEEGNLRNAVYEWMRTGRMEPFGLVRLIGSPYWWQELFYAVSAWASGMGLAYWLRGRGAAKASSWGAGLLLAFSGYWLTLFSAGHGGWFVWMTYGVFGFGLADRAVRKGKLRHWVMLGACLGWASMYQPDLWFIFTVFNAAYFVWCCAREKKLPGWKGMAAGALAFALTGGAGVAAAVGAREGREQQIEESKGTALAGGAESDEEARWVFVTNWSLPPWETLEFVSARVNGDTSCPMVLGLGSRQGTGVKKYTGALGRPLGAKEGNYRQHSLYMGKVTWGMIVWVLWLAIKGKDEAKGRRGEICFLACAMVLFWGLSLGRNCEWLYRWVFALPVGDSLRAPVKWHHLTELCGCMLAGFGLDALVRRSGGEWWGSAVAGALAAYGAFGLAMVDRKYCAAVDLSVVRNANAAAETVLERGGGKVLDLVEGGHGMMARSFGARGIETTGVTGDAGVRFVWMAGTQLRNGGVDAWLKKTGATMAGAYNVGAKGIAKAGGSNANALLLELPGRPKGLPAAPEAPEAGTGLWLGLAGLAGMALAGGTAAAEFARRKTNNNKN